METRIEQYILAQPLERQDILKNIHSIIVEEDKTVIPLVELMMGKEMIVYKGKGLMKYGLASVKSYMSLYVMPIYGSSVLFSRYKPLLPKANFQKGCINFGTSEEIPTGIVRALVADCSGIDLSKMREDYLMNKKKR